MQNKNVLMLLVVAYAIAITGALIYVFETNRWAMTHPKQVEMVRSDYEQYDNAYALQGKE